MFNNRYLRLIIVFSSILVFSCQKKDDNPDDHDQYQFPLKFSATAQCTTYNSNGSILQIGAPYTYLVTMNASIKQGFDFHFKNFSGDSDTSVNAIKNAADGSFVIPLQDFKTSNGSTLQITGQGAKSTDSLNYSWSFYMSPTYRSHNCICKAKRM